MRREIRLRKEQWKGWKRRQVKEKRFFSSVCPWQAWRDYLPSFHITHALPEWVSFTVQINTSAPAEWTSLGDKGLAYSKLSFISLSWIMNHALHLDYSGESGSRRSRVGATNVRIKAPCGSRFRPCDGRRGDRRQPIRIWCMKKRPRLTLLQVCEQSAMRFVHKRWHQQSRALLLDPQRNNKMDVFFFTPSLLLETCWWDISWKIFHKKINRSKHGHGVLHLCWVLSGFYFPVYQYLW